ncbi:uncharacterized protein K452DRAFT_237810 [Aplosporella prunicola CBS 121167]|uniref:Copper-fist domain-containing protein n=1 Tax=Aplosporella prunicola CBS 121167 TaxID=1176127 RepID=A0A6A6AYC8_9PEZI|nr:uncharacterized protein K452DRAFT_237810 [Aplosporella prunicola CBS 121167]KAF2136258.1 hypothetical protein K452DRAFT_237810 [Aplosporella prunicola CBS 121167]
MPIVNGEKYACDSCIKGHRVSGCTHSDRPLKHINPKGRPVKQCEHCQKARKTKSHHARCDCGTKKDKTKAAAEKAASEGDHDTTLNLHPGQDDGCRCFLGQGGQCICGLKKDPLDLRIDTGIHRLPAHLSKSKPPLVSSRSEAHLTVFANGHHKPCHGRLNNTAHTSGVPYKIPRHHTMSQVPHHQSHDNLGEIYSKTMDPARRSVDSLNLNMSSNSPFGYFTPQSTAESVPLTPLAGSMEHDTNMFDPSKYMFSSQPVDKVVGGTSMPHGLPMSESVPVHTYPWMDNMYPAPMVPQYGLDSISTSPTGDITPDVEFGLPTSHTDININPWSAGDLPLDPNKLSESFPQPISHSGDSNRQSMPGMTTSSGTQSEVGEPPAFGDMDLNKMQQPFGDQMLDGYQFREPSSYRLSTQSLQSLQSQNQQLPTSVPPNENRRSLDVDYMRGSQGGFPMSFSHSQSPESMFVSSAPMDSQRIYRTAAPTSTSGSSESSRTVVPTTGEYEISFPPAIIGGGGSVGASVGTADASQGSWFNFLDNGMNNGMNIDGLAMPVAMDNTHTTHEYSTWL